MESANELYREIVEQAPDGVIVASIEGTILLWNDRAEVIFGYSRQEVWGRVWTSSFLWNCVRLTGKDLIVQFPGEGRSHLVKR